MTSQQLSTTNRYGYFISGVSRDPLHSSDFADDQTYLDLDDILATQELVPCRMNTSISSLSFEYANSSECFIPVEQQTEYRIPLWLAQVIHSLGAGSVSLPEQFQETFREIMNADATVPNVNEFASYYFRLGAYCTLFNMAEAKLVADVLLKVFSRFGTGSS